MDYKKIQNSLEKYDKNKVLIFTNYIKNLCEEKDKEGKSKNGWTYYKKEEDFVVMFEKLAIQGLYIDGDIVTIQSTGVSLSYSAYKNLVLIKYPETKFFMQLVRETDEFKFEIENGKVIYSHKMNDPFAEKNIIGAYCIIKNRLGEFIEIIGINELEKIRKTAKTDYIWQQWTSEMYLKTVIKRACKRYFKDITQEIDNIDNNNYDLDNPLNIDLKIKQEIENISNISDLKKYYEDNKEKVENKKEFHKLIVKKQEILKNENIQ